MKDVLEDRVDEKYYLSQKIIETFTRRNEKENGFHFDVNERDIAKTVTAGVYKTRMDDNYVKVCGDVDLGNNDMNNRVYDPEGISPILNTMQGGNTQPKVAIKEATKQGIRKLTPLECWRLMGFTDEDFKKSQQVNSNSQLYKQAGNSIVKQVLMAIFRQMI